MSRTRLSTIREENAWELLEEERRDATTQGRIHIWAPKRNIEPSSARCMPWKKMYLSIEGLSVAANPSGQRGTVEQEDVSVTITVSQPLNDIQNDSNQNPVPIQKK